MRRRSSRDGTYRPRRTQHNLQEQCLPQPSEIHKRITQLGMPRTLQEWEARRSDFFPGTALLPAGWTRKWDSRRDKVLYCRMDGSKTTTRFPPQAPDGAADGSPTTLGPDNLQTDQRGGVHREEAAGPSNKRARVRARRKRAKHATSSSTDTDSATGYATVLYPDMPTTNAPGKLAAVRQTTEDNTGRPDDKHTTDQTKAPPTAPQPKNGQQQDIPPAPTDAGADPTIQPIEETSCAQLDGGQQEQLSQAPAPAPQSEAAATPTKTPRVQHDEKDPQAQQFQESRHPPHRGIPGLGV